MAPQLAVLRGAFDEAAHALSSELDLEQRPAADRLAQLGAGLLESGKRRWPWSARPRGVYLHGPVGRGKTWLADVLHAQLPGGVLRLHAYESAQQLHAEVARQSGRAGAVDRAVDVLLDGVRVLFLDELHAHDPGDARILFRLVRALPERGAVLVATSNYPPKALLPDPRYHHLVLPLAEALEEHCDIVEVTGPVDHRSQGHGGSRPRFSSGAWVSPGSPAQLAHLGLTPPSIGDGVRLQICGRALQALQVDEAVAWFEFSVLCEGHTSANDLLELAGRFDALVLVGVPPLAQVTADAARRFANLIDVAWDRDLRLIVVAATTPESAVATAVSDRERMLSRLQLLQRV